MRFSGMAQALEELFSDPNADLLPFREKVGKLVDAEWELRYTKKLNRFLKRATLKYPAADLDDTIYDLERQLNTYIIANSPNVPGSSRDPGKSTMVVSQFPAASWYDLFQEHTHADACLNRLLHNAYRLEMNGKNMRNLNPMNT